MKFCPYCGAPTQISEAAFCSECGRKIEQHISDQAGHAQEKTRIIPAFLKKRKKAEKKPKLKELIEPSIEESSALDENADLDYDGYYDDILPGDINSKHEFVDRSLLLKVLAVVGAVTVIISMCVVALYLL